MKANDDAEKVRDVEVGGSSEVKRPTEPTDPKRLSSPLDAIGQRNELLRVRFGQMVDRLNDLQSLSKDFDQLVRPLESIIMELPQAKSRVQEVEALLSREISVNQDLRREVDGLSSQLSASQGEYTNLLAKLRKLESEAHDLEATGEERRLALAEKTELLQNAREQLVAELEHREQIEAELAFRRAENEANDQSLQRAETQLRRDAEQLSISEQELRRLTALTNSQLERLNSLEYRNIELSQLREESLKGIANLEARLQVEQAARQKSEAEHENAVAYLQSERSSVSLKLDAAQARLAATEQVLTSVRNQFREREEAARAVERMLKEASVERSALERRIEGLRSENEHHLVQAKEYQRARQEADDRIDMLGKALAAKDAALENALTKNSSLNGRLESMTKRFENDRLSLEAVNRRIVEELEGERAERTLAQGALEIARENRIALQRQNEILKRSARALQGQMDEGDSDDLASLSLNKIADTSNVSFFSAPEKSGNS